MAELTVTFSGGEVLRFGPGSRAAMVDRARDLAENGAHGATFAIDGKRLDMSESAPEGASEVEVVAGLREDAEVEEAAAREAQAQPSVEAERGEGEQPSPPPVDVRRLDNDEAARLSEEFLRNAVSLSERIIDRASERGLEALEKLVKIQERQAELQSQHLSGQLAQAAQLHQFVGSLAATVAEERLATVRIRAADVQMQEAEALKNAAREVQMAKITAERDIRLAELNRPSPAMVLLEFAATFAAQYAQNAAANFMHMNDQTPGAKN